MMRRPDEAGLRSGRAARGFSVCLLPQHFRFMHHNAWKITGCQKRNVPGPIYSGYRLNWQLSAASQNITPAHHSLNLSPTSVV